jgi:hypothetical protein
MADIFKISRDEWRSPEEMRQEEAKALKQFKKELTTVKEFKNIESWKFKKLLDLDFTKKNITIQITKNKDLTTLQKTTINKARISNWGKSAKKDFKKDYEPNTLWFFVKDKKKIVSFGGLRPIKIKYLNKTYNIGGICSTISLEKKKGYGKIMVLALVDYSKRTKNTLLGFTEQTSFFKKTDLETKKDFVKRFVWIKPNGEKIYDDDGDGIYFEGKDKFISRVLKTKSMVPINVEYW